MKATITLLITILVVTLAIAGFNAYEIYQGEPVVQVIEKETIKIIRLKQVYYEREEINSRIKEIQSYEDYDKVINLYGEIAGNREIAMLLLNHALVRGVPVNLAFALCRQESGFNPQAKNENVKGGKIKSRDYGLMQLNTVRFAEAYKEHGLEGVMIPEMNISLGLKALEELYYQHNKVWDRAIIAYNGRFALGAAEHLVRVYTFERKYDKLFNDL